MMNKTDFLMDVNEKGQVILRHMTKGSVSTPVTADTGQVFPSQLEASKAYKVASSCINNSVKRGGPIKKTGPAFRYATQDEVLDWLTAPPGLKPINTPSDVASHDAQEVRLEIVRKLANDKLAEIKEKLADVLAENDRLEAENRKLRSQAATASTAGIEGFEFPGGPAVLRIGKDCVIVRPTKNELPQELVAACNWRT